MTQPIERVPTSEQLRIPVTNPVTGAIIGHVPESDEAAVMTAVERARQAQTDWAARTIHERAHLLRQWADLIWQQRTDVIDIIRQETGKPESSALQEIMGVDHVTSYYAHRAPRWLRSQSRNALIPVLHRAHEIYKPHGVVGFITPWNYPYLLLFLDLVPALIAGNTAVIKPSEVAPFTAELGVQLMREVGVPADVVQIVHGQGTTGAALVGQVDFVAFTGSTATGRKVAQRAAERLIPYSMELGGKDPAIVLADADLDIAASELLRAAFENAGQACLSIERAYVVESIYDRLLERLQHHAKKLVMSGEAGMDVHVGSLTNKRELQRTEAHLADALAKGAQLLMGGYRRPDLGPLFYEPTMLADCDHSMLLMQEETFGPLLPLIKVADTAEAIRLANDSDYGLSASIFSRDLRAAQKLASRLNCGDVHINRSQINIGTPDIPSGGQRGSGVGRRNGYQGLMKYVTSQSIVSDTRILQPPSLTLFDPLPRWAIMRLRALRRWLPFL